MSTNPNTHTKIETRRPSFLFLYDNMNTVMILDSFLKGEESTGAANLPKMYLTQNRPKAVELLRQTEFNFIIVDQSCIVGSDPKEWIESFHKVLQGGATNPSQLKTFLLANNLPNNDDLEVFLRAGYDDVFIKPLDMPIIAQKINNIANIFFSSGNQLYFAPITSTVKLAFRYQLDGLSEAGAHLVMDHPIEIGTVFTVIIPEFEKFGIREIVAKVLNSVPHPKKPNKHSVDINFVGIQPNVTKTIRRWMVEEYIKGR